MSSGPAGGKLRDGREGWARLPWLSHMREEPSLMEDRQGPGLWGTQASLSRQRLQGIFPIQGG